MWRKPLVVFALTCLNVLGVGSAAFAGSIQLRTNSLNFTNVSTGIASKAQRSEAFFITNQVQLNNYWVNTFGSLAGEPSNINWGIESVAAVNLGQRATNGYGVFVRTIVQASPTELKLTWSERTPPTWAAVSKTPTSPFVIVKFNRTAANRMTFAQGPSMLTPLATLANQGIGVRGGGYYDVPWLAYNTGGICQVTDFYSGVIVDYGSLQNYWTIAFGASASLPTDIDFSSEQLVVLNLGRRPSTGYGAVIQGLKWLNASTVQVEWYEQTPAPGTVQAQHITSPFTMVKIPSGNVTVNFKKITPPATPTPGPGSSGG